MTPARRDYIKSIALAALRANERCRTEYAIADPPEYPVLVHDDEDDNREPCPGCGDGDKVPTTGYWRCPVCDAEWHDDDDNEYPPEKTQFERDMWRDKGC